MPTPSKKQAVAVGALTVPAEHQDKSGDHWQIIQNPHRLYILAADGLGHGAPASEASLEAANSFENHTRLSTPEMLKQIHQDIRKTRGAVCFTAIVDLKNNSISYTGIGNISARLVSMQGARNCVSYNGIVGYTMPRTIKESHAMWGQQDMFIICSDGITSRWSLNNYPHIEKHDPLIIAAALYKDHRRSHDDALVIVVQRNQLSLSYL